MACWFDVPGHGIHLVLVFETHPSIQFGAFFFILLQDLPIATLGVAFLREPDFAPVIEQEYAAQLRACCGRLLVRILQLLGFGQFRDVHSLEQARHLQRGIDCSLVCL